MAITNKALENRMILGTDRSPDQNLTNHSYISLWGQKHGGYTVAVCQSYSDSDSIRVFEYTYTNQSSLLEHMIELQKELLEHDDLDSVCTYCGISPDMIETCVFDDINQDIEFMIQCYMSLGSGYYVDPYDITEYADLRSAMLSLANYY